MSIVDFIAVVSFGLTCFGLGYTFGKDNVNYSVTELPEHLKSGGIPPFFRVRP